MKIIRGMQAAAVSEIVNKRVTGKSVETLIAALLEAVKVERQILGISEQQAPVIQDNRVQVLVAEMENLPPERRDEYFRLQRDALEIRARLGALVKQDTRHPLLPGADSELTYITGRGQENIGLPKMGS